MWNFIKPYMRSNNKSRWVDKERNLSYMEVMNLVDQISVSLANTMFAGAKCSIYCQNQMNTALSILACWAAGLIPIPLSKHYGIQHCYSIIREVEPDFILTDHACNMFQDLPTYNINSSNWQLNKFTRKVEDILEDVAFIMCTSGTTGSPKGVMITHDSLQANILGIQSYFAINAGDNILIARPLYHCAVLTGEFLISLINGLNIYFHDENYDVNGIIGYIQTGINVLCGTPVMMKHISQLSKRVDGFKPPRVAAISGEKLSQKSAEIIRSSFVNTDIYNVYGLTEASPRVSSLLPEYFDAYPEAVGLPLPSVRCQIVDEQGTILPTGTIGRLFITGPSIMKGYYRKPELTAKKICNHWLDTGDLAYIDEKGFLYIQSRADDLIIRAGMNIYPAEIENRLLEIPFVQQVMAYGTTVNDQTRIHIQIVPTKDRPDIDQKALFLSCRAALPMYSWPDHIEIVERIPQNASGKVVRPSNIPENK